MSVFLFNILEEQKYNNFIIWRPECNIEQLYSYETVIKNAKQVLFNLSEYGVVPGIRVAIQFECCPQLIVCILSVLNLSCSFCPISPLSTNDDIVDSMQQYRTQFLLSSTLFQQANENHKLNMLKEISIFDCKIYLYVAHDINFCSKFPNMCYSIKTSGTTGKPKVIEVPYECIMDNVIYLSSRFSVTKYDLIFCASPPTFDPFVLDLFLALRNSSQILLTTKEVRVCRNKMCQVLFPTDNSSAKGATIIQVTPSVFRFLGIENIRDIIFASKTSLRILVFGGEPFPNINEINRWINSIWPVNIHIFNIYGITEISCWSTIQEVQSLDDCNDVCLGSPMGDNTVLQVRDPINSDIIDSGIGELFIGSSIRKCLINDETSELLQGNEVLYRATGDLVTVQSNSRYYYKGRKNDTIKRFGHRVNLKQIEDTFQLNKYIKSACCIFDGTDHKLFIFLIKWEEYKNETVNFTTAMQELSDIEKPDKIIFVEEFPVTCHGKISKSKLMEIYQKTKGPSNNLMLLLKENFMNLFSHIDNIWKSSFPSLGGTSFQAMSILLEIENLTKQAYPELMQMLLKNDVNLNDCLRYIANIAQNTLNVSPASRPVNDLKLNNSSIEMVISWHYNLKKCVDASITCHTCKNDQHLISAGSHSHSVTNLTVIGNVISSFELPDRIESQVIIDKNDMGFVGCYNGYMYKFNPVTGERIWQYDSGGMIKCRPTIFEDLIIFGNYSEKDNLFCLNIENGEFIWSVRLGTKGILSSPQQLDANSILVCTLDGTCARLNSRTGQIEWIKKFMSPIFSNSSVLFDKRIFILAEVDGNLHFCTFDGNEILNLKVNGNVFSSFVIKHVKNDIFIFFGCFDKNLYCIKITNSLDKVFVHWKTELQSQIYSTPKIMNIANNSWIISCSSSGFVNICDLLTGIILDSIKLNGEIFSTPAVESNQIFVGCRDNNIYCIEVSEK